MHTLGLQKILGYLLMPAGLLWLGILLACLWNWRQKQRGMAFLFLGIFLLYGLAGNRWVGLCLVHTLERRIPPLPDRGEPFDAVWVLGGGSDLSPGSGPELSDGGDRIAAAARLWHSGRVKLLVASGTGNDGPAGPRDLGQETRQLWLGMGVPPEAILVETGPCDITREEIAALRKRQEQFHWKRVAILSSAWHLPRAMALAHRAGLEPTPIGADWRGRERTSQAYFFVPQAGGFTLVELACWEYLGRWVGR
jgi:uncharacterized SAM-binding protein YcdF (DUF218 family)